MMKVTITLEENAYWEEIRTALDVVLGNLSSFERSHTFFCIPSYITQIRK